MKTINQLLKVTCIQCNASNQLLQNLQSLQSQMDPIPPQSTDIIIVPEMATFRRYSSKDPIEKEVIPGKVTQFFADYAKKLHAWIIIGSLCETIPNSEKVYNTSVVITPEGKVKCTYRKIHLFNCTVPNNIIDESTTFEPGDSPQMVQINGFSIGLSICYDLRFPELFCYYRDHNTDIIIVPSSFTHETGKAHWHTLLQSRAIETQCYICAPNQYGIGGAGVNTYGHSLIIDPWGTILAEAPESEDAVITATLSKKQIDTIRNQIPVHHQKKQFEITKKA